jgi:uncharacterized protein YndB with AHSA1/START domain
MLLVYTDEQAMSDTERQACYQESAQLTRELEADGKYLAAAPLHPVSTATSVQVRSGRRLLTDGPFAETREQLGGYYVVEARDLDDAIAIAGRIPAVRYGTVEVRPVLEIPGLPGAGCPDDGDFLIAREFAAPRDLVWKAFTEADRLSKWWGPKGMPTRVIELDARPGGTFRYVMNTPDGQEWWGKFTYRDVCPPERLVNIVSFTDRQGNPVRHPMSPTWPAEVLNAMTLEDRKGGTRLTVRGTPFNATDEERRTFESGRDQMRQGFTGTLDQLEAYLSEARQ